MILIRYNSLGNSKDSHNIDRKRGSSIANKSYNVIKTIQIENLKPGHVEIIDNGFSIEPRVQTSNGKSTKQKKARGENKIHDYRSPKQESRKISYDKFLQNSAPKTVEPQAKFKSTQSSGRQSISDFKTFAM